MLTPTQDKDLHDRLIRMFQNADKVWFATPSIKVHEERQEIMVTEILKELEQRGYHKGLPPSIEEALNSGDGVYRP